MQMLLNALRDPEVPVVVYASMSLGFFINRESRTDGVREHHSPHTRDGTHCLGLRLGSSLGGLLGAQ